MARKRVSPRQRERYRKGELGDLCWLCLPGREKRREARKRSHRRELDAAKQEYRR